MVVVCVAVVNGPWFILVSWPYIRFLKSTVILFLRLWDPLIHSLVRIRIPSPTSRHFPFRWSCFGVRSPRK